MRGEAHLESDRPGTGRPMRRWSAAPGTRSRSEKSEETLVQEVAGTMSRASCGNKEMKKKQRWSQQHFTETRAMHGLC